MRAAWASATLLAVLALASCCALADDADASLAARRQAHQAEIDYYVQHYDGADVALACAAPAIPSKSVTPDDIRAVGDAIDGWLACYNGFLKQLRSVLPAGKSIPYDIAVLMTDAEMLQAAERMDRVYAQLHADAKQQARGIIAARDTWQIDSNDYADTADARSRRVLLAQNRGAHAGSSAAQETPAGR